MNEVLSTVFVPNGIQIINSGIGDCNLLVDKVKILRAFNNLIKNAFDAMPNGGELHITSKINKKYVQIDFSDNGVGMSKQVIDKMWVPFFTTKARGMGIGLPMCKRIIEAHGGEIKVESTEGKGTTFTIYLPIFT
jgi:two-component system sporulation sensor kinase C